MNLHEKINYVEFLARTWQPQKRSFKSLLVGLS